MQLTIVYCYGSAKSKSKLLSTHDEHPDILFTIS
ncbi:hypothetical protein T11_3185 [Trichinella zimbabwensis]|uniref:Uncharacterized protein n=1 Tax=Trichinella zimbabwensis TaxID=268475 RepID=A0A0V1GCI1_9BILA|nr:hypothetical protein T11_8807 [Trichinella zimbabwensis]KRY96564.1 hypothetical protein T11_3185 [Trichinella zimbabwensis]